MGGLVIAYDAGITSAGAVFHLPPIGRHSDVYRNSRRFLKGGAGGGGGRSTLSGNV